MIRPRSIVCCDERFLVHSDALMQNDWALIRNFELPTKMKHLECFSKMEVIVQSPLRPQIVESPLRQEANNLTMPLDFVYTYKTDALVLDFVYTGGTYALVLDSAGSTNLVGKRIVFPNGKKYIIRRLEQSYMRNAPCCDWPNMYIWRHIYKIDCRGPFEELSKLEAELDPGDGATPYEYSLAYLSKDDFGKVEKAVNWMKRKMLSWRYRIGGDLYAEAMERFQNRLENW
jgi:hypothetical protein